MTLRFAYPIHRKGITIHYLRSGPGGEGRLVDRLQAGMFSAFVAFSKWSLIVCAPSEAMYKDETGVASLDADTPTGIVASTTEFNYLWDHPVNLDWEARLVRQRSSAEHLSMLVSLHFTDAFRSRYGVGAELLLCNFVDRLLREVPGMSAIVSHGLGWNDATMILQARPGAEHYLVDLGSRLRYCTEADCVPLPEAPCTGIIASIDSQILGSVHLYVTEQLSLGSLASRVSRARVLFRVSPAYELDLRRHVARLLSEYEINTDLVSEFGHYTFSVDVSEAFARDLGLQIMQRLRRASEVVLMESVAGAGIAVETAFDIGFSEQLVIGAAVSLPTTRDLHEHILMLVSSHERLGHYLTVAARHRLLLLTNTIARYLSDPLNGAAVLHLSKFLTSEVEFSLEEANRTDQDDFCDVLESAVAQAVGDLELFEGLSSARSRANVGGYSRVMRALNYLLLGSAALFDLTIAPLLTVGLRPVREGVIPTYWLDLSFSVLLNPSRWHILYHQFLHVAWSHIYGARVDGFALSLEADRSVVRIQHPTAPQSIDTDVLLREIFPSFAVLNALAAGDIARFDELMVESDFEQSTRPLLVRSLLTRMTIHVLLNIHARRVLPLSPERVRRYLAANARAGLEAECLEIATSWWEAWRSAADDLHADGGAGNELAVGIEEAARVISNIVYRLYDRRILSIRYGVENLVALITDPVFKDSVRDAVLQTIRLMELRAAHFAAVSQPDPADEMFGYVLAKIEGMRVVAKQSSNMPSAGVAEGWVSTFTPLESGLRGVLATSNTLAATVSSILSLSHLWSTVIVGEGANDACDEMLRQLGLVRTS